LKKRFVNSSAVPVGSGKDEKNIAYVMNHKQEYADQPKVHHVREEYQEH